MDMCEYIEAATSQIRARRARDMVARELEAHIEDQAAYYKEQGMSEAQAEQEAVRQMGNPVEVGISMDQIHRPRTDWKMILMLVFLCGLGLSLQIALNKELIRVQIGENEAAAALGIFSGISRGLLAALTVAVVLGVLVCVIDYTVILRYAPWFIGFVFLILGMENFVIFREFWMYRMFTTNQQYLLLPLYASLLYRNRGRGGAGFAGGIFWLVLFQASLGILGGGYMGVTSTSSLRFGCVLLMMLSLAVICGWYGDKRSGKLIGLWSSVLLAFCLAVFYMLQQNGFRAARIRAILHPYDDAGGAGYYTVMIRGWIGRCSLWGNPEAAAQFVENYMGVSYLNASFAVDDGNLLYLFLRYGIVPGVMVCLIFVVCMGYFLYRCLRQKNQLGRVTGAGCCMVFLVEFAGYLMSNLGGLPIGANLPFLSYGGTDICVWAVLMGFVFSIIRYQNLLPAEHRNQPARYRYRLKIEKIPL